jgi:hypothetical protein
MVNPYRGEVELTVNGVALPLRLSLGALAELENNLGADGLAPLIDRFESGAFKSDDLIQLLFQGLKTAGWEGSLSDLAGATIEGGPIGAARCAGNLLRATFTLPDAGAYGRGD